MSYHFRCLDHPRHKVNGVLLDVQRLSLVTQGLRGGPQGGRGRGGPTGHAGPTGGRLAGRLGRREEGRGRGGHSNHGFNSRFARDENRDRRDGRDQRVGNRSANRH